MNVNTETLRTAKILLHYYPKRARKPRFLTLTASAKTEQEAIKSLENKIYVLRNKVRKVVLKNTFSVFDSKNESGIIIEYANCNLHEYHTHEHITPLL